MVAGILHDSGYFAGNELLAADASNPRGYFEDRTVNAVNDTLIHNALSASLGYRIRTRFFGRRLPRGVAWLATLRTPVRTPPAEEAVRAMEQLVAERPFCFKDPRFCYTLPAWKALLPQDIRYVVVFRHPNVTADSIVKRANERSYGSRLKMDRGAATRVWLSAYRCALMLFPSVEDTFFVHYDRILSTQAIPALETFLGTEVSTSSLDPDASRTPRNPHLESLSSVPRGCRDIYLRLLELEAGSLRHNGVAADVQRQV